MSEERKKILNMLAQEKITVEEAEKLLAALDKPQEKVDLKESSFNGLPKYLRVVVEPGPDSRKQEKVNIRVPFQLLRAGIKLASVVPADVQGKVNNALKDKGIDLDLSNINPKNLEEIVNQLKDLTVDVDSNEEKIHIFCE
ncbi:MAG: hypothetical protein JXB26_06340 [Candidatus Aminicenantes bacterium]|nr:hypothetical protein [Candidatus Aminicenantes bacterium]